MNVPLCMELLTSPARVSMSLTGLKVFVMFMPGET